jgi:hypothetical protein
MQPPDLHYEKAVTVPGWDKSLWPERGRWFLNVRLARWSTFFRGLLAALATLAIFSWAAASCATQLGLIVAPDFVMPRRPFRSPWLLLVSGSLISIVAIVALAAILATMAAKAWQALRNQHASDVPDPDYRAIDFRARRRR